MRRVNPPWGMVDGRPWIDSRRPSLSTPSSRLVYEKKDQANKLA